LTSLERLLTDPRITVRKDGPPAAGGGAVVYWMQRAQRGIDNAALDVAIEAANALGLPVAVFFGLHPNYPNANLRHYAFLLDGVNETRDHVERRGAAFVFRPYPHHNLFRFCDEVRAALVVGDENPLREPERWRQRAARQLRAPFWTVDADVVVPTKLFPKEEYAARTLRPKIERLLEVFLHASHNPQARVEWASKRPASRRIDAASLLTSLPFDRSVSPVTHYTGGTREALHRLNWFIENALSSYDADRNQPTPDGTSRMSPYLHFGHISPITVALAIKNADAPAAAKQAYLEELIVRRELAINFVARNPHYDSFAGCPEWARKSLSEHAEDPRPHLYSSVQLEHAETHDALWNAAQTEMVKTGRMHGYLRMYWAKKILEWSRTPAAAFRTAVKLNDRYFLDGRDPNGYTGIAWAIGGKHDRPWPPRRPVFGLVRYMSAAGMSRRFDAAAYIRRVASLS
jgi:deoxyribodipyrimidine photo-lyase